MVETIFSLLKKGENILENANIESYRLDALVLLCHVLNIDKTHLIINKNNVVSEDKKTEYLKFIELRKNHMPVKYITGICEFMALDFEVNLNVLIPRPDTEILVEKAIEISDNKNVKILDLCCGSGCIGISLASYIKNSFITLVDISEDALFITNKNIIKNNVQDKTKVIKKDILNDDIESHYDIIVSNPPYINEEDYYNLESDVLDYEPKLALLSPNDEYKFYKRIIKEFYKNLNDGGYMLLEMGYNQSPYLYEFTSELNIYNDIKIIKDYNNIERVLILKK